MDFFKNNKLTVTVIVLSVAFLLLIGYSYNKDIISKPQNGVGTVFNSFQSVLYNVNNKGKNFINLFKNFSEVKSENEKLKAENSKLQSQLADYNYLKSDNANLRKLLNFKNDNSEYENLGGDIIGKWGSGWIEGIIINRGSDDGVATGMVVAAPEGLVGQVTSVSPTYSKVETISNENIAVSGIVESTRDSDGVVRGYRDIENRHLAKMDYLPQNVKLNEGDTILTSGIGGMYPKNIRIGSILSIEEEKGKLMKSAIIQPYVDFSKLEEVYIILPKNKRDIKY